MNERIKKLRKSLGLTQTEFGSRIGVKGNTVTGYETGLRSPSDAVIFSICREFNVSEDWLRTGTGQMFVELSDEDQLAIWAAEILKDSKDSFRRRVVKMLMSIPTEEWEKIAEYAKFLYDEEDNKRENSK